MEIPIKKKPISTFWYYFWQIIFLIPIIAAIHYCRGTFLKHNDHRYTRETNLEITSKATTRCQQLAYEVTYLRRDILDIKRKIEEFETWNFDMDENLNEKFSKAFDIFYSDQIGMFDYASEYAGGSIISTSNTIPYPSKQGLRLFGFFELSFYSKPNLLLQHTNFPGKCFAFQGDKGQIQIALARPVSITHVSLEHLKIGEASNSAPKDFQVLGFNENGEQDLGRFVYDLDHSIIQTFRVIPRNQTFRSVELRILSNYGNADFTCIYRFRVHSLNLNLK